MLSKLSVTLAGLALVVCCTAGRAQEEELRGLVTQAQKAHGGKELLKKYPAVQAKYKGTVDTMGMNIKIEGEMAMGHERMKNVIDLEINNMKIQVQQGYDGKALWLNVAGNTTEIKDADSIKEMKESFYCEQVANLVDLETKDYKLAPLGEVKIMGKDAVGVRVSKEGKRDVNLWLDKKSHLLLKSEFRAKDPFGQQGEANQEKYFFDYKAVQGIQTPRRVEVHNDGKKLVDMEISDMRYHERLDESAFGRP